jgi:hypothetical protein
MYKMPFYVLANSEHFDPFHIGLHSNWLNAHEQVADTPKKWSMAIIDTVIKRMFDASQCQLHWN